MHRYAFFGKAKRMKKGLSANAGWYTLPTKAAKWPYGLSGLKKSRFNQKSLLKAPLVVMLGEQDLNTTSRMLRKTPEAMAQGPHRYARGIYFIKTGAAEAKALNIKSGWSFKIVKGVGHDNRLMAKAAAAMIDAFDQLEKDAP